MLVICAAVVAVAAAIAAAADYGMYVRVWSLAPFLLSPFSSLPMSCISEDRLQSARPTRLDPIPQAKGKTKQEIQKRAKLKRERQI